MIALATQRDAQDVAIEFGEHLAATATAHMQFMANSCQLMTAVDKAGYSYQAACLKSATYEFENGAPIARDKAAAIELARGLAKVAAAYLDFMARTNVKSVDPDGLSDHFAGLRSAIYEFEKRAARAAA